MGTAPPFNLIGLPPAQLVHGWCNFMTGAQAADHLTTVTNITSALGSLLQQRGDVVLGRFFSEARSIGEATRGYWVLMSSTQRSPDANLIAGMADVIRGALEREKPGPQTAVDSMAAGAADLVSPAGPQAAAVDGASLDGLPDGLADAWRRLKDNGSGAMSAFQEGARELSDGGVCISEISTYNAFEKYLSADFGCHIEMNCHRHQAFIELRRLPRGLKKPPSDLKTFFHRSGGYCVLQGAMASPQDVGLIISFGEGFYEYGGLNEGRLGTHIFYITGEYDALKMTFEECRRNPKLLGRFVGYVFEWGNDKDCDSYHRRVEALVGPGQGRESSRVRDLRPDRKLGSCRGAEPDITICLQTLYSLDVGEGYGSMDRVGNWRRRKFGMNRGVVITQLKQPVG